MYLNGTTNLPEVDTIDYHADAEEDRRYQAAQEQLARYRRLRPRLDVDDLAITICERFSAEPSLLALIDEALTTPFAPGDSVHISDALKLAKALVNLARDAVNEAMARLEPLD
jgi:hypothetical protein